MHMDSVEAMEFVSEKGVEPNLVYIDGDRRYKVRQRACHMPLVKQQFALDNVDGCHNSGQL